MLLTQSVKGSISIIGSILRKRRKRKTTYNQLVLGISVYDILSSLAYLGVGVLAPQDSGFL